jgi:hypothetical protein
MALGEHSVMRHQVHTRIKSQDILPTFIQLDLKNFFTGAMLYIFEILWNYEV